MAVPDLSNNGLIDSSLISQIIASLNNQEKFLNELGYQNANEGLLYTARAINNTTLRSPDVKGADDFKVYAVKRTGIVLKKDLYDHGEVTIPIGGSGAKNFEVAVATLVSPDWPAFACIKTPMRTNPTSVTFDIITFSKPTRNISNVQLNMIAVAIDADAN